MTPKSTFSAVIAFILLALYVYLVGTAVAVATCTSRCTGVYPERMASALLIIAGLISALVIAELAITEPGKPPVARALASNAAPSSKKVLGIVTWSYMGVWLLCGIIAFLVGLNDPDKVKPLTNLGEAWFGLAVASGYAYFGLSRKEPGEE